VQRILLALIAIGILTPAPACAAKRVDLPDKTDLELTGVNGRPLSFEETRTAVLVGARRRGFGWSFARSAATIG